MVNVALNLGIYDVSGLWTDEREIHFIRVYRLPWCIVLALITYFDNGNQLGWYTWLGQFTRIGLVQGAQSLMLRCNLMLIYDVANAM